MAKKELFTKLRIVFDVDDVLVSFTKGICKKCEEKFHKKFRYEDVVSGFKNCQPEEIEYIESLFCDTEFIESLPMIRGAKKAVEEMVNRGHEVLFCTATYSNVMTTRALYIINHFKGIHPRNIIITGRKDVVECDIMFDDSVNNLINSKAKVPVAVTSPWNNELIGFVRAEKPDDYIKIVDLVEQGYTKHDILKMQQPKYEGSKDCCIILQGPSAAGKTVIAEYLVNTYPDKFEKVVTDTTRAPRDGEVDGVSYNFRTEKEFLEIVAADGYAEYSEYAGKYYGSSKIALNAIMESGKCPIIVLDKNGAEAIKKAYPNNAFSVFVERDKEELIKAILDRNIPIEDKAKRIAQLDIDINAALSCTYSIKNNTTVAEAAESILALIP